MASSSMLFKAGGMLEFEAGGRENEGEEDEDDDDDDDAGDITLSAARIFLLMVAGVATASRSRLAFCTAGVAPGTDSGVFPFPEYPLGHLALFGFSLADKIFGCQNASHTWFSNVIIKLESR